MVEGRGRRPKEVVTRCMGCGDALVVVGPSGEPEVPCRRQRCRKAEISTPIRSAGFVRVPQGMDSGRALKILELAQAGKIPVDEFLDSLVEYRRIKNLIVIGPREIEKSFLGPNGENPLNLASGWCPQIPLPEKWTPELLAKLSELCETKEWSTAPILWLAPKEVGGKPTSLINQYGWWGMAHDGYDGGSVKKDTMWSNWFIKDQHAWALEPAVSDWTWRVGYELPQWSVDLNWQGQQKAVQDRGLTIASAASDALMLNLVAVATGRRLRIATWARTATICGGCSLGVSFRADGLDVRGFWHPGHVLAYLGVAAEGVPKALIA